jgi:6,7-dimethyl-8-ribityllumazine synthase
MFSALIACPAFQLPGVAPPAVRGAVNVRMATGNDAVSFPKLDGSDVRIGILKARWHDGHISNLMGGIKSALKECGVPEDNIVEYDVPGSFELPLACRYLALTGSVDAIIPVGVLIKGETTHFEVISESVTKGIMDVGLSTGVPCIFGVLTALTEEQIVARSTGSNNHGTQWGMAAVDMALLRKDAMLGKKKQNFFGFGAEVSEEVSKPPPQKIGF